MLYLFLNEKKYNLIESIKKLLNYIPKKKFLISKFLF
jgi:hypothetical protein